jgi:hypothetical protein
MAKENASPPEIKRNPRRVIDRRPGKYGGELYAGRAAIIFPLFLTIADYRKPPA